MLAGPRLKDQPVQCPCFTLFAFDRAGAVGPSLVDDATTAFLVLGEDPRVLPGHRGRRCACVAADGWPRRGVLGEAGATGVRYAPLAQITLTG